MSSTTVAMEGFVEEEEEEGEGGEEAPDSAKRGYVRGLDRAGREKATARSTIAKDAAPDAAWDTAAAAAAAAVHLLLSRRWGVVIWRGVCVSLAWVRLPFSFRRAFDCPFAMAPVCGEGILPCNCRGRPGELLGLGSGCFGQRRMRREVIWRAATATAAEIIYDNRLWHLEIGRAHV